jgi:hypothetical protein
VILLDPQIIHEIGYSLGAILAGVAAVIWASRRRR